VYLKYIWQSPKHVKVYKCKVLITRKGENKVKGGSDNKEEVVWGAINMLAWTVFAFTSPQITGFALDMDRALLGVGIVVAFIVHLVSLRLDVPISVEVCPKVTASRDVSSGGQVGRLVWAFLNRKVAPIQWDESDYLEVLTRWSSQSMCRDVFPVS
jgi:hypothetical protein